MRDVLSSLERLKMRVETDRRVSDRNLQAMTQALIEARQEMSTCLNEHDIETLRDMTLLPAAVSGIPSCLSLFPLIRVCMYLYFCIGSNPYASSVDH